LTIIIGGGKGRDEGGGGGTVGFLPGKREQGGLKGEGKRGFYGQAGLGILPRSTRGRRRWGGG